MTYQNTDAIQIVVLKDEHLDLVTNPIFNNVPQTENNSDS